MKAPPRLLDDPATAPELRSDLERTAGAEPGYDVAAGLVALQAAIVATAAVPASSAAAAQAGASAATAAGKGVLATASAKIGLAALGTAVVVVAATAAWPKPAQRARDHAPAVVLHAPAPAIGGSAPALRGGVASDSAPALRGGDSSDSAPALRGGAAFQPAPVQVAPVAEAPSAVPEPALATPAAQHAPSALDRDAVLRREIAQLGQIKALVERDPRQAVRLAQQGDREFGRGMLGEERSALAIVALWNDGRQAEATRRAQAFVARYPHSPSRERIERLLSGARE